MGRVYRTVACHDEKERRFVNIVESARPGFCVRCYDRGSRTQVPGRGGEPLKIELDITSIVLRLLDKLLGPFIKEEALWCCVS